MAEHTNEIHAALSRIRRRARRVELLRLIAAALVEIAGLVLVFMLVDWLYKFTVPVRLALLGLGAAVVLAVLAHHVFKVLGRKVSDRDLALFVENANPELQGALLAATEFGGTQGSALHNYIVSVLVGEANRRIHVVDIRKSVDLGRLKKYGLACVAVLFVFVATGAFFPQFLQRQGRRIMTPWVVRAEDNGRGVMGGDEFYGGSRSGPVRFRLVPGDTTVLEGATVEVVAELSRDPMGLDTTLYIKTEKGQWEPIAMEQVARLYTRSATLSDISRPIEYYVAVGNDQSEHHKIAVRQRLKVTGIEQITQFPDYLKRDPEKALAYTGDIATLTGSKVTLDIKTNQKLTEGWVVMGDGSKRPLDLGASGGRITLAVDKNNTYRYVVRNEFGEEVGADRLYFIQALDDKPPAMEVMEPNNDLTVTPMSEVTCVLNVTEDWALESVRMEMEVMRQGPDQAPVRMQVTREFKPASWTGRVDAGSAELVLPLEEFAPRMKPGDSIFYHFEVADRKGQKAVSDIYFISIADPEVFVYYGRLDWHAPHEKAAISPLMQYIAEAWRLEHERATMSKDDFQARCTQLADKMIDPKTGRTVDFIVLGVMGDGKGPKLPDSDPRKKVAADHTEAGVKLLRDAEPGKAVVELNIVWAILKQFFGDAQIMLASADVNNPNKVFLEKGETFAHIDQMNELNKREVDVELKKQADQQAAFRRMLGRKEMEKVDKAKKDIEKIKNDVAAIADQARENPPKPDAEGDKKEDDKKSPEKPDNKKASADAKKTGDDKKTGDADKKTGDDKKGEDDKKTPDDSKQSATGEDSKTGDSKKKKTPGDGKDGLKEKALDAARAAEDVAKKLQEVAGEQKDRDVKAGIDRVRRAAEEMKRAALDFDEKKLDTALGHADAAHRMLDDAQKDLDKVTSGRLTDAVAEALGQAHKIADREKMLREATGALEGEKKEAADAKAKGDKTAPAKEELLRDRQKGVATAQQDLSRQAEAFKDLVDRVHEAAKQAGEKNAERALDDGATALKQGDLPQKMVDAAVAVEQGDHKGAKEAQDDASKTLSKVVDSLYRASDALSGTKEGALARAAERAKDIKKKGLDLAGMSEKDLPKPADTKTPGDDTKKGPDDSKKTEPKPDDKTAKGDDETSKRRRTEEAAKLWTEVKTLAGDLKSMDAVPEAARNRLDEIGEAGFSQGFADKDKKQVAEFLALISRISTVLDEKLVEAQTAKKLESGLRDECPPAYRRLVGKYYSVLSTGE